MLFQKTDKIQQVVKMIFCHLHNLLMVGTYKANMNRQQTGIHRKLHIREAIANHNGASEIHLGIFLFCTQSHTGLGLTTRTLILRVMRTAINGIEGTATRTELRLQGFVYLVYRLHRTHPFAYTLLIGNQEYMLKLPTQHFHRFKEMRAIDKLAKVHHVIANELLVHHAIAVHK